jgi:Arabinose-binding domain of AraC transcription regulator, N-term
LTRRWLLPKMPRRSLPLKDDQKASDNRSIAELHEVQGESLFAQGFAPWPPAALRAIAPRARVDTSAKRRIVGIVPYSHAAKPRDNGRGAVLDLLKAAQRAGLGLALLCRAAGLSAASLEESDARVPTRLVTRVLDHAEERARDPLIGIHAGERSEPRGPLIYLVLSSARFAEGLRQAERFIAIGHFDRL